MKNEQEMCSTPEHDSRTVPSNEKDTAELAVDEHHPATRRERKILERLHTDYGAAFEVYLDHVWRGTPITDMEADFINLYWASYDTPEQFAADGIDAQGWRDAIEDVMHRFGIPQQFLRWDYHAAMRMLGTDFEFHERGGQLHAFIK